MFYPTQDPQTRSITTQSKDMMDAFASFVNLDVAEGAASPDTVRGYFSQAKMFVDWCIENHLNPADISEDDLKSYRQSLVADGYKPGTIAHKLAVLRRFYTAAHERGLRPDNPAAGIKAPRSRKAEGDIPYLSEEELTRLLDVIPRTSKESDMRDLAIVAFLGLQARRQIEAHRANVADIRPDGSMIVHGKYHDTVIQLRNDVEHILSAYVGRRRRVLHDDMGEPVFVAVGNRAGGRRISVRSIRDIVDGYLEKAGLKRPGLSGHALRHTAATLAYEGTKDLRAVQDMLGHRDPKTTGQYAHIVERRENNPAESIRVTL